MIELSGTRRERLDQAIRLAYTEVSEAELEHFRAMYRKAGIALLPAAEALYRRYGGVFRKQYLFLDDPVYNRDVYLAFYADISDSEKEILRRFDEAMQDIDQVRAFAKQELCPIGDIGFYYPACVYVGEDGLLYCIFEYRDEIEVHSSCLRRTTPFSSPAFPASRTAAARTPRSAGPPPAGTR